MHIYVDVLTRMLPFVIIAEAGSIRIMSYSGGLAREKKNGGHFISIPIFMYTFHRIISATAVQWHRRNSSRIIETHRGSL